jgi:hypothetical protein
MSHGPTSLRAISVLLLAVLACGVPSQPSETQAVSPTETGVSEEASPTAVASEPVASEEDSNNPLEAPLVEEPPPSGLFELFEQGIASGEWSREEGLIAGLKLFAGEASLGETFGEAPVQSEGTGLLHEALYYLQTGSDSAAKAEIERLLQIVAPSPDRLLEYAQPASASSGRGPGLASVRMGVVECEKIYADGFPKGGGELCLEYTDQNLGSYKGRIFYPSWWTTSDPEWPFLEAARQAVADSWNLYATFGEMRAIDLVFTLLGDKENPWIGAIAPGYGGAQSCQIAVYPGTIQGATAASTKGGVALGGFKQLIAHEMFHCFQAWRFPAHSWDNAPWEVNDWWGESTAEFFSNLVYPTVNNEWQHAKEFDFKSNTLPIFELSYANFEFFQYLGSKIGENAILSMIDTLPPNGSTGDHQAALSAYPSISSYWHEFGRLYLDERIKDTSGDFIPRGWPGSYYEDEINGPSQKVEVAGLPFTLARRALLFNPKHMYQVELSESGPAGNHGERFAVSGSPWSGIPPKVPVGCGKVPYLVLATTTASVADVYEVTVTISTLDEPVDCDPCLVGSWDLDLDSFQAFVSAPFAEMEDFYDFITAQGIWRYAFHQDGTMKAAFNFAYGYTLTTPGFGTDPLVTEGLITFDGQGIALWWVSSPGTLDTIGVKAPTIEHTVDMGGQVSQSEPGDFGGPGKGVSQSTYVCSPTTLTIWPPGAVQANLPPLDYIKVSGP